MTSIAGSDKHSSIFYQDHNGIGDIISGDKIIKICQNLAPETLRESIEVILSNVRNRKIEFAKAQFETIKTSPLEPEGKVVLDILSVHLDLVEDEAKSKARNSLLSTLKIPTDSTIHDLCLAALIRLDAKNNRIEEARERYIQADTHLSYSQEMFYEFVATADELVFAYKEQQLDLDESQLIGLIRGALRTQLFEFSLTIANRLKEISPSFNSKVLWLVVTACNLEMQLGNKHYWTITARLKAEIIKLIDEVVLLINQSKGSDSRLLNIAAVYWHNIRDEHQQLENICLKYIDEIETARPEVAAILRRLNTKNELNTHDLESKCRKAQNDKNYRNQLINEIFAKNEIYNEDYIIIRQFYDCKLLRQWIGSGGKIIDEEDIVADFNYLMLLLLALPDKKHPEQKEHLETIKLFAENIVKKHKKLLPNLHPVPLLEITQRLGAHPTLSVIACDLINPILPASDLWASPIVESYLNALLIGQQMATLESVLTRINQEEKNVSVWWVQAHLLDQQNDFPSAIKAIDQALKINPNVLDLWHSLVHFHRENEISDNELAFILKEIPDELLSKNSDKTISLLIEIAKTGDFARAETIIISWFIENPNTSSKIITEFINNIIIYNIAHKSTEKNVGDSIIGVRYKKDDDIITQLLVNQENTNHPALLDINSDLGNALYRMKVGETEQHGMYDLILLERLAPSIAAFQISLQLRHTKNDGSDGFYLFSVPKEPNKLLELLKRKLSNNNRNDNIFNNSVIPFICKGHFLDRNDPVKAALQQLLKKNSVPCFLPDFGEENVTEIIFDVYAITYLAITGLAYGINHSSIRFIITHETKMLIEHWLTEGYFPVNPPDNLEIWRQSTDSINEYFQKIVNAFRLVIDKAEVAKTNLVDMPPCMLYLVEIVDISVYSSLCLSIGNGIPWLCIDDIFARCVINPSGYKQVNASKLIIELGCSLSFEQKKDGFYLYAEQIIPYALGINDLILLSISNDKHAHYALAKIIYLHLKPFPDTKIAVAVLTTLLIPVLEKAYWDRNILKGLRIHNPSNNGYAEKVFNACCHVSMQCDDGNIAERKLAMLLCRLFLGFNEIQPMIAALRAMTLTFATGHFMDISMLDACIKEELNNLVGEIQLRKR